MLRLPLIAGLFLCLPLLAAAEDDPRAKWDAGCETGDSNSCMSAGAHWLSEGYATARRPDLALERYEAACTLGDPAGCHEAGLQYYEGKDLPKDLPKARERFTTACIGKYGAACSYIGDMLMLGEGGPQDQGQAVQAYYTGCSDYADFYACHALALAVRKGTGTDLNEALSWEIEARACDGGTTRIYEIPGYDYSPEACGTLGYHLYELGDYGPALDRLKQGCNGGAPIACRGAGIMIGTGTGTEADAEGARQWFREGCRAGDEKSCDQLAATP